MKKCIIKERKKKEKLKLKNLNLNIIKTVQEQLNENGINYLDKTKLTQFILLQKKTKNL